MPCVSGGLLPGDSHPMVADPVDDGDVPMSPPSLRSVALRYALDADTVDGLQLGLSSPPADSARARSAEIAFDGHLRRPDAPGTG